MQKRVKQHRSFACCTVFHRWLFHSRREAFGESKSRNCFCDDWVSVNEAFTVSVTVCVRASLCVFVCSVRVRGRVGFIWLLVTARRASCSHLHRNNPESRDTRVTIVRVSRCCFSFLSIITSTTATSRGPYHHHQHVWLSHFLSFSSSAFTLSAWWYRVKPVTFCMLHVFQRFVLERIDVQRQLKSCQLLHSCTKNHT